MLHTYVLQNKSKNIFKMFELFLIMSRMCIVQIDLRLPHILLLLINIVQMHCLTKHDQVVSYIPLHFDEIQHSFYLAIFDLLGL
jgi:hypothetical protein